MKNKMMILTVFGALLLWTTTALAQIDEDAGSPEPSTDQAPPADPAASPDEAEEIPALTREISLPEDEPAAAPSKVGIAAAAKVGATFHTIFNELSPMILLEVEAGVLLLDRHLEIDLALAWTRPKSTLSKDDPRLVDGSYDWEIKQDFLSLGLMGRYRFLDRSSKFNVYGALGPRLLMLHTRAEGKSETGNSFGVNEQFETRFGFTVAAGGELNLGLGAILLELGMTFGDLNGYITGDTSSSALETYLGYRFMFDL